MRLERVEISGFFHFAARATLDLRTIPPGVVAIVGPNGGGKSRLLDAALAALYGPGAPSANPRAFPSRRGTLADYATSREAYIEALWTLGDARYMTRVNVDGDRRTVNAAISTRAPDDVVWHPLNDGRVTTYRERIAELFPSRPSVLASAFAAQSRNGSFVELGQTERLELFMELADLAHYEEKAETARRAAAVAERVVAAIRPVRDLLERETGAAAERALEAVIAEADRDHAAAEAEKVRLDADVLDRERSQEALRARVAEAAVAEAEVANARERVGSATEALRAAIAAREQAERAAYRELADLETGLGQTVRDLTDRLKAADATLAAATADAEKRIAANEALIRERDVIRAAVAAKVDAETRVARAHVAHREATETRAAWQEKVYAAERGLDREVIPAERSLDLARTAAATIDGVPCHAEGEFATCRFLTDAAAAREEIPALEATAGRRPGYERQLAEAQKAVDGARADLAALGAEIAAAEASLAAVAKLAARETDLVRAEEQIARHAATKAAAKRTHETAEIELHRAQVAAEARALGRRTEIGRRKAETLAVLGRAVAEATDAVAAAEGLVEDRRKALRGLGEARTLADEGEGALRAARAALTRAEVRLAEAAAGRAQAVEALADLRRRRALATTAAVRERLAEDEFLAWTTLAKACGRDGLPRLEIDAAGPTVSTICNDLLAVGYGPRFSVDVVTQVATADGKGTKERFTIQALDNLYGGEPRDIGDLSGGERVVVEEALRAALCAYVNARNRQPVRTCWRDETTGALSPENVAPYVAMLRKLRAIGGFDHVLFITQSPEAAALADAQIRVADGVPALALPPYREAA